MTKLIILKEGFGTLLDGKEWFYNDMSDEEATTWSAKKVPQSLGYRSSSAFFTGISQANPPMIVS